MTEEDIYNLLVAATLKAKYQAMVDDVNNPRTIRNNITGATIPLASITGSKPYSMKKHGISYMFTLGNDEITLLATKTIKFFSVAERLGYAAAAALPSSQQNEPVETP